MKSISVGNKAGDCGKRKRDESGRGAGGEIAKKRCFNQSIYCQLHLLLNVFKCWQLVNSESMGRVPKIK